MTAGRVVAAIVLTGALVSAGLIVRWFGVFEEDVSVRRMPRTARNPFPRSDWDPNEDRPASAMRVLFLGNSFTHFYGGQALVLEQLARAGGETRPAICRMVAVSQQDFAGHWRDGESLRRIREGRWDYVVLQDHSLGPLLQRENMFQYGRLLDSEIRKVGAKTVFFLTWAPKYEPENQAALTEAYTELAGELDAEVAPVAIAWRNAVRADPSIELYDGDGKHPNEAGVYLTSCVFYAMFYGRLLPEPLPGTIRADGKPWVEVNELEARFLQRIAAETVATSARSRASGKVTENGFEDR